MRQNNKLKIAPAVSVFLGLILLNYLFNALNVLLYSFLQLTELTFHNYCFSSRLPYVCWIELQSLTIMASEKKP